MFRLLPLPTSQKDETFLRQRIVGRERLDFATRSEAERNLRDLVRINRWFGGHQTLLGVLRDLVSPLERFSVLDVGAASGDMAARVRKTYRNAFVVSLDRREPHLARAAPPRIVADASALPFKEQSFDFVLCSLVLHHSSEAGASELVRGLLRFARRALIVIDLERHPASYCFLPFTGWLFGWSELTVHDGCLSVAAGFKPRELKRVAERAGAATISIRRHLPWFRISAVMTVTSGAPAGRNQPSVSGNRAPALNTQAPGCRDGDPDRAQPESRQFVSAS